MRTESRRISSYIISSRSTSIDTRIEKDSVAPLEQCSCEMGATHGGKMKILLFPAAVWRVDARTGPI